MQPLIWPMVTSMKAWYRMGCLMGRVGLFGRVDSFMMEIFIRIRSKGREGSSGRMEASTRVKFRMGIDRATAGFTPMQMAVSTSGNGTMDCIVARGGLTMQMDPTMKVSSSRIKSTGRGKWSMLRRISMKARGFMIRRKEKVSWTGIENIKSIQANGWTIFLMDMGSTIGFKIKFSTKLSKLFIRGDGFKVNGMDLECFSIPMGAGSKDILKIIRKMG